MTAPKNGKTAAKKRKPDAIAILKEDHAKVKKMFGQFARSDSPVEKEELAKISVVTLPPVVRLQTEIAGAAPPVKHQRPSVSKPDDLSRYLIGTRWNYYSNDKFLGQPKVLEFTGPDTATLDGDPKEWKVLDKTKIWLEGNREFRFSKNYDEFSGGWVPNPKDRNTARILK